MSNGGNYKRGRAKEWEAKKKFEALGYKCCRMAGSHGAADIIVWNDYCIWFVQLKRFKKATKAQKNAVVREALDKLEAAQLPDCVIPVVLIYIDHHGWEIYYGQIASENFETLPEFT